MNLKSLLPDNSLKIQQVADDYADVSPARGDKRSRTAPLLLLHLLFILLLILSWTGAAKAQNMYGGSGPERSEGRFAPVADGSAQEYAPGADEGLQPTRPTLYEDPTQAGSPAWAQNPPDKTASFLQPFGANLFSGNFSNSYYDGLNPSYLVKPGDRVSVKMWGARTYEDVLVVDQQGNLFIPEIGPVQVAGQNQKFLLEAVKTKLGTVYTSQVEVYVNLMNAQPVAVYCTGFVNRPGRYAGGPTESPLYYLDLAGGINVYQGSYRNIEVRRHNSTLAVIDLYEFINNGNLPSLRLQDGDSLVVKKKGLTVGVFGRVPHPALYELKAKEGAKGSAVMKLASPLNSASHVSVSGVRNKTPFRSYMSIDEFRNFILADNDTVEFHANKPGDTIMVTASGAVLNGSARYPVKKGTMLSELLRYIPVDREMANWPAVYVRRNSVATQQRQSITEALRRLEHSALTATSSSVDEAKIRVQEAELIQDFVKRAGNIQPNGVVVVSHKGQLVDMPLEDGDTVVIPQKTSVITVSGEVMMPNSVAWSSKMALKDYISGAGGYTDRANRANVLIVKPNGEVGPARSLGIEPGDRVMVMPEYDTKNMQIFKDITQIIYQIAIATGVAVAL